MPAPLLFNQEYSNGIFYTRKIGGCAFNYIEPKNIVVGGSKLVKNTASPKVYESLISHYRDYIITESIRAILVWDQLTYIPPKGIPLRGEQLAHLSKWRVQFL